MRKNYFIQSTGIKKHKGVLHRQLGIPAGKKLPPKLLVEISNAKIGTKVRGHEVTTLLKRRVVLARTLGRIRKK